MSDGIFCVRMINARASYCLDWYEVMYVVHLFLNTFYYTVFRFIWSVNVVGGFFFQKKNLNLVFCSYFKKDPLIPTYFVVSTIRSTFNFI